MTHKFRNYIKKIGLHGVQDLAKKIGMNYIYMYQLANIKNTKKPLPKNAIALHKITNGFISFTDWYTPEEIEEVWPSDMFIYRDKNDRS